MQSTTCGWRLSPCAETRQHHCSLGHQLQSNAPCASHLSCAVGNCRHCALGVAIQRGPSRRAGQAAAGPVTSRAATTDSNALANPAPGPTCVGTSSTGNLCFWRGFVATDTPIVSPRDNASSESFIGHPRTQFKFQLSGVPHHGARPPARGSPPMRLRSLFRMAPGVMQSAASHGVLPATGPVHSCVRGVQPCCARQ